jgi:hypothetical protein
MDKSLLATACWNSGILAFFFLSTTIRSFSEREVLWGIIGIGATLFTIADTVKFYNLM